MFAFLLPLRPRAARAGLRAIGLISAVLLVVNVVEGSLRGFVPGWVQVEMFCVAALMAINVLAVIRVARAE